MSIEAYKAVWGNSKATGSARLVMLCLAEYADDTGVCWPSLKTIASMTRVSLRQVKRAISQLEAGGEIEILRKGGYGRGHSTSYRITLLGIRKGDTTPPFAHNKKGDMVSKKGDMVSKKGDMVSKKGDMVSPDPNITVKETVKEPPKRKSPRRQRRTIEFKIPEILDTPEFRQLFTVDWPAARAEQGKRLTQRAVDLQLKELSKYPPHIATAMVQQSIMNQWQGIFALKGGSLSAVNGHHKNGNDAPVDATTARLLARRQSDIIRR